MASSMRQMHAFPAAFCAQFVMDLGLVSAPSRNGLFASYNQVRFGFAWLQNALDILLSRQRKHRHIRNFKWHVSSLKEASPEA